MDGRGGLCCFVSFLEECLQLRGYLPHHLSLVARDEEVVAFELLDGTGRLRVNVPPMHRLDGCFTIRFSAKAEDGHVEGLRIDVFRGLSSLPLLVSVLVGEVVEVLGTKWSQV